MHERIAALLIDGGPWAAAALAEAVSCGRCPAFPLTLVQAEEVEEAAGMLEADRDIAVVLLGLRPSGVGEPESVLRLKAASPAVSVLALADPNDEKLGARAVDLGAAGYVVRGEIDPGDLRRRLCALVQQRRLENGLTALRRKLRHRGHEVALEKEFVDAFSHDCRTPLTVIKTALTCLKESLGFGLNPEQAELLRLSDSNCGRLLRLVENLLELSRLRRGRPAQSVSFDAESAARASTRAFRLLAPARRVVIAEEYAPGLPPLRADPDLFAELLDNLLSNALRYARSRICVGTALDPDGVRVTVSDDGPGIPAHDRRRLFRRFGKAGPIRGPDGRHGTGLGLAICREIVRRQHGRIWVESEQERGTKVHFVLPCCPGQAPREGTARTGAAQ